LTLKAYFVVFAFFFFSQTLAQETKTETPEPSNTQNEGKDSSEKSTETLPEEKANKTQPATDIKPPISLIEQYEQDIKNSVDQSFVTPMLAGTEDFLTIVQPDMHHLDKGVAILLAEWGQAATDVKAINHLRQYLPEQGWTTITIQPVAKPTNYPSSAEKIEVAQENDEKALSQYKEKLTPILTAVMEKAADYPGIFLVIAQGNNAAVLLDLYQTEALKKPNAFIALSAHMLTSKDNHKLANQMANSPLPILDIVLKKDLPWVEHFAPLRKKSAQKELKPFYRQRVLNNFRSAYYPEHTLTKEIKGWLTSIGW